MIIETRTANPGLLFVFFEQADFRLKDQEGKRWVKAKDEIKSAFPFPQAQRDPEEGCRVIKDGEGIREKLAEIKKKYFEDENQEELF